MRCGGYGGGRSKDDSSLGDAVIDNSMIRKGGAEREAGLGDSVGWGGPVLDGEGSRALF